MGQDNITFSRAAEYDAQIEEVAPHYAEFHRQAIDLVKSVHPAPKVWLDTGCGTGRLAAEALAAFPRTLFLLADPSPAMLEVALERLKEHPAERVRFLPPADSEHLPEVTDTTPQVITAMICHHYLTPDERAKAVAALYGMLPEGGLFITFEVVYPHTEKGRMIGMDRWRRYQLSSGRSTAEVDEHQARIGNQVKPVRAADHIRLLKETGFSTVEQFWRSGMNGGFYGIK